MPGNARIAIFAIASLRIFAAQIFLHGKVNTDDGSAPIRGVTIEKVCTDSNEAVPIATTNAKGEFILRVEIGDVDLSMQRSCVLRAALKGYGSTTIEFSDTRLFQDPNLAPIQLIKRSNNPALDTLNDEHVPGRAARAWSNARKAANANRWVEAERDLRAAVTAAPRFAQGWQALASVLENQQKIDEARQAERRAIELNPRLLVAYLLLARLDLRARDWEDARKSADALIRLDPKHRYAEAYIHQGIARFQLKDTAGAEASIQEAVRLDLKRDFPRAEYIWGMILQARHENPGALVHMNKYLELEPKAFDAAEVRTRIEHIDDSGKAAAVDIASEMEHIAAQLQLAPASDAWVPGGIRALAEAAGVPGDLSYSNFFTEFCRTQVRENSPGLSRGIPHYQARLLEYFATVAELSRTGARGDDGVTITMSMNAPAERAATAHVLSLLGWKWKPPDVVEPGDEPVDGLRQPIPAALGIDEISMQRTFGEGKTFRLRFPAQNARLIGGDAWSQLIGNLPSYPGGIAEAFVRDPRLAKVYAGLGSMGADTASAVVSGVGLQALVEHYADVLARDSDAFALRNDGAAVPGNPEAWTKLAGTSPGTAAAFFHALVDRDFGSLAAFCARLARADRGHQKFFTATPTRAERFYAWYRDSGEPRWSALSELERWRGELLEGLPLGEDGTVRFPGGRRAWTDAAGPDDEILLKVQALRTLVPVARIEQRRKSPLDETSARLLAANFSQWRALFPYFEKLPALGAAEFEALASFTQATAGYPRDRKRAVLGEWDSLVELIERAAAAGSLDGVQSARAFREACEWLTSVDHAARAMAIFHEIGRTAALRFSEEQRTRFERVLALQNVPGADAAGSRDTVAALSGLVYAASLDPDALLVNEDPRLLAKHQFAGAADELFPPAKLVRSSHAPGSYLSGTFVNIDEIARGMPRAADGASGAGTPLAIAYAPATDGEAPVAADFRAEGRLVEVYATVTDSRGRYVDDLTQEQFSVLDRGQARPLVAFESRSAQLSVALLLDVTASMVEALPALKVAALKLIEDLRPDDQVAVYSFNDKVSELAPFTADKDAAKRAVVHTEPFGETALYDALARVTRDLMARTGKKVIVVFTDGDDNASTLTAGTVIQGVKGAGVPVYTIAQGAALTNPEYLKQLAGVSQATGGASYAIHNRTEIRDVFGKISQDLMHAYFFAFRPEADENHEYRPIEVRVSGGRNYKVRAREGYSIE